MAITTRRWKVRMLAGCLLTGILAAPVGTNESEDAPTRWVAVDLAQIDIDLPVTPDGSQHALPTLRVRNPGDVASDYQMVVQPVAAAATAPPAEWVSFSPERFTLEPGEDQPVVVTLTVPEQADAAEYVALLAAQLTHDDHGARVGAAAASRLRFTVAATESQMSDSGAVWWLLLTVGAAGAFVGGRWIVRRYQISIARRS